MTRFREGAPGRDVHRLAMALGVLWVVLLALHLLYDRSGEGVVSDVRWRLDKDRGYGELCGYASLLVAAVLLALDGRRLRAPACTAWAAVLVVLVLDDATGAHEEAGAWLRRRQGEVLGLDAQDVGELLAWGLMGLCLLALVLLAHRRTLGEGRRTSTGMFWVVGLLVAVGVGLDFVDQLIEGPVASAARLAEDAGELLIMFGVLVYVVAVRAARPDAPPRAVQPGRAAASSASRSDR